jgi:hypothetical protein
MASTALTIRLMEHLLQLNAVSLDGRQVVRKLDLERDAAPVQFAAGQGDDLENGLVDIQSILLRRHFLDECAYPADDLAGPLSVLDDPAEGLPRLVQVRCRPGEPVQSDIRVDENGGNRLVDLMGDRGDSCPMVATRLTCASCIWASRKPSSARLRSVISWTVPNMRRGCPFSSRMTSP